MVTAGSFRAGGLFIFVKEMINIAIKLATSITYTADGSQTNFSIPFDYLRPSFVHVAVNDAEVSEGFTVSNRGIMFDTAPAKDALVKIYRKTPTSRLVSWADASILKAIDMTIAEVQQLHILEEASDWSKTNSIVLDEEGNTWQGRNCRMSNIADPTGAQDVVTKHYLDNEEGSFTATMNALKTKTEEAASTAETNAKQAQTSATNAKTSETNAKTSETNAKTSETNVNASKEAAQSAANSASNFATDARSSASEAKSYRDAASTYATNAKNYSENVNVFVPSVSTDGVLSWSNKAGLTNPPSVNIKGKDGADGGVTVDDALSDTSTNAIQNKVVKAALDNRAVLDDTNTFTSPNKFDDIYMADGMSSLKWYNGSPNFVVASINSERYTGEANTAKKATKDGDGNIITSTYATKTELNSYVKSVNNTAPDDNGNVNITVSGGGVTVDEELSSTSTHPVQNKAIYNALLGKVGTEDIFNGFALRSPTASILWRIGSQTLGSLTASNYTGTALRATQDGDGNVITSTYATKTELNSCVKTVNNVAPDSKGNVNISVSGGSNVTVDAELSATSTNPVQNKVIEAALKNKASLDKNNTFSKENLFQKGMSLFAYRDSDSAIKWYQNPVEQPIASIDATNYTGTAAKATQDGAGNVITETYATKADVSGVVKSVNGTKPDASGNVNITVSGGSNVTVDTTLSSTSNNAIANKAVYNALSGKLDKTGTAEYARKDGAGNVISTTYIKSVNNVKPDSNGNVSITASGGNGVSLSAENAWTGKQTFQKMKFNFESYNAPRISGATDNPSESVAVYNVQGNFTLDMSVLAGLLSNGDATLFTAYITANGTYTLSITNAGTLKYAGSAADLAITASGLLLNIFLTKSASGIVTSIAQATKLS